MKPLRLECEARGGCAAGLISWWSTPFGNTTISGTLAGGGWTLSGMAVYISGVVVTTLGVPDVLDIKVNSPDISGNLSVGLEDVGRLAAHLGHACP